MEIKRVSLTNPALTKRVIKSHKNVISLIAILFNLLDLTFSKRPFKNISYNYVHRFRFSLYDFLIRPSAKYITLIMIVGCINMSKLLHLVLQQFPRITPRLQIPRHTSRKHHPYETLSSNKREVYFEAANRDSYVETRAAERSAEKFTWSYSW